MGKFVNKNRFRENLWQLGQSGEALRICHPGQSPAVSVFVAKGRYWGHWTLHKQNTHWAPINDGAREIYKAMMGESAPRKASSWRTLSKDKTRSRKWGLAKTMWKNLPKPEQHHDMALNWAYAQSQELGDAMSKWRVEELARMRNLLDLGIRYRDRIVKHMAKTPHKSLVRLIRAMYPKAQRSLAKMVMQVHTMEKLKRYIKVLQWRDLTVSGEEWVKMEAWRSITYESIPDMHMADFEDHCRRYGIPLWREHRRRYLRPNGNLNLDLVFQSAVMVAHYEGAAHRHGEAPAYIHRDLDRLPTVQAIQNMEAHILAWQTARREEALAKAQAEFERDNPELAWSMFAAKQDRRLKAQQWAKSTQHWRQELIDAQGTLGEPEGVTLLASQAEFEQESAEMKHCVQGYSDTWYQLCFKVDRPEGRATLRVQPKEDQGLIMELRGHLNSNVSPALWQLLSKWVKTLTLTPGVDPQQRAQLHY